MGFFLSALYFVTYYLTPTTLFGSFAEARVELILAAIVMIVSLPGLARSFVVRSPQLLALIGLAFAVLLSVLVGVHWAGGAVSGTLGFIPNAFAYMLVGLHCNSRKRLKVLVVLLVGVCIFVIARGYWELQRGGAQLEALQAGRIASSYLMAQRSDAGEWFYRLRGQGQINDPNDFGQLIVCTIPLVFIFWRPRNALLNLLGVVLPVAALLFGVYLTHSRGALLALLAIAIFAARRRIGTIPALLLAGGLFVAASALHFTGGREISATSGSDRTGLWGAGLQMLKSHPLFGVGYGNFADSAGLTAHNSIVVCAAELGLFGLFFWSLFLFPTVRDILTVASSAKVSEGELPETGHTPLAARVRGPEILDKAEINRLGRLVALSLTGFLVAGLFLSRAYVLTLFLLGGVAEAVFEMALQRGMVAPRLKLVRIMAYAGILTVSLVLMMYVMVRVLNVMR